jgi:hypothetical protein
MTTNTRDTAGGRAYLDLQNRARRERRPTQEYLTAYVIERWLARLSRSPFVSDFVLKGGARAAARSASASLSRRWCACRIDRLRDACFHRRRTAAITGRWS